MLDLRATSSLFGKTSSTVADLEKERTSMTFEMAERQSWTLIRKSAGPADASLYPSNGEG
jgi:hypothetical protein